ncbi:MAG: motility protein A [Bacteroidota bacterium]
MAEKSTPIGLGAGFLMIYGAIFMGGSGWVTFFDPTSLLLVLGGTTCALLVAFTMEEVKSVVGVVREFFFYKQPDLRKFVDEFTELARLARREGLLALDRRLGETEDPFMSFGLELAVDGIDEDEIHSLMTSKMRMENDRTKFGAKFFNIAATYCPAFGMVGTLIGLIQMLQNLADPSTIGGSMAVAMVTTFYGAFFANLVFMPTANKMKTQAEEMYRSMELVRTGVMGIVKGESPSMLEKRLMLYLDDAEPTGDAELAQAA